MTRMILIALACLASAVPARAQFFSQIDVAASKHVQMPWPNGRLEFRFEAFNLLNRTYCRAPNGNRSAAGFGTITSTRDARQIQFGLKLAF